MAHNGSRLQVNFNALNFGGEDAFLNRVKQGSRWSFGDSSGVPLPSTLNANGYPTSISNGGVATYFKIASQASKPLNWKARWTGEGTVQMTGTPGGSPITGSNSGVNGYFTCRPTATDQVVGIAITAINVANPITNLEFYYEPEEALLDAGEMFTPEFLTACRYFGRLRFLNWMGGNGGGYAKWAHRKPLGYAYWAGDEARSSIFRGTTTHTGDAYSCNLGDGGSPSDGDAHIIVFDATAASESDCTLNGKAITSSSNTMYSTQKPEAGKHALVIYSAGLGKWIKFGGDATAPYQWLNNGVPPEVMMRLCKEVGAHGHYTLPYLSLDGPTDFAAGLAALCKSYSDSSAPWMKSGFEPANEVWNYGGGFVQTPFADALATARWGAGNHHDTYGRWLSLMGAAVSAAYSSDRSRYDVFGAVQTFGDTTASAARFSGRHVSVSGGTAGSTYATDVLMANYYSPNMTQTAEMALADTYAAGNSTVKAAAAAQLAATADDGSGQFCIDNIGLKITAWKAFATGLSLGVTAYEGGYSPDYQSYDTPVSFSGATKAAQCVLTVANSGPVPPAGYTVSLSGFVGMTQLNGNSYTVVSSNDAAHTITINVNSTGFSTYTSGGSGSYVGSGVKLSNLRAASKAVAAIETYERKMFSECLRRGMTYPSVFELTGNGSAWAVLDPDIFADSPRWTAIKSVAFSATPIQFKFV